MKDFCLYDYHMGLTEHFASRLSLIGLDLWKKGGREPEFEHYEPGQKFLLRGKQVEALISQIEKFRTLRKPKA